MLMYRGTGGVSVATLSREGQCKETFANTLYYVERERRREKRQARYRKTLVVVVVVVVGVLVVA